MAEKTTKMAFVITTPLVTIVAQQLTKATMSAAHALCLGHLSTTNKIS